MTSIIHMNSVYRKGSDTHTASRSRTLPAEYINN